SKMVIIKQFYDSRAENNLFVFLDICRQPHSRNGDTFSCEAYIPSWSYDSSNNKCVSFIYGGCQGNDNRFFTKEECEAKCLK
ncbi:hypothetical protein KR009_008195, partial [Drosophila setifemur]